ncbi:MAG: hypothetical protein ABFR05_05325 [Bacteroidota bacterium]
MKDNFENIFKDKRNEFDFAEPNIGHFERFEAKLKGADKKEPKRRNWIWLSIAASVILILGVWMGNASSHKGLELADVSPKMEETQDFFTATIQQEIKNINKIKSPQNEKIIDDAFKQLEVLEVNYKELKFELKESNEDKRVIYAMISNFQQRIEVLQNLMQQLEDMELVKISNNVENKV